MISAEGGAYVPCLTVRLNPERFSPMERLTAAPLHGLLRNGALGRRFPTTIRPVFGGFVDPDHPCSDGPSLADWHRLSLYDLETTEALYQRLQCQPDILEVHRVLESPGPPTLYPSGTQLLPQTFRQNSPRGVGSDAVQAIAGARGEGVSIADIEHGWALGGLRLAHPDLPQFPVFYLGETNAWKYADHGTSVLGILSALHNNGIDVNGVADLVRPILLLGNRKTALNGAAYQTTDTQLGHACSQLFPGDVVLVEAQTRRFVGDVRQPAEVEPSVFAAIQECVKRGITVVAAAGNGASPLPTLADSGSILVAGGSWVPAPPNAPPGAPPGRWDKMSGTNFGPPVHCFAEGESVATTTYLLGAPDPPMVTDSFSGTSAAAAIIAGVAASVQGMVNAQYQRRMTPAALRALLGDKANGTIATDANLKPVNIGVMPDLERLAQRVAQGFSPGDFL